MVVCEHGHLVRSCETCAAKVEERDACISIILNMLAADGIKERDHPVMYRIIEAIRKREGV